MDVRNAGLGGSPNRRSEPQLQTQSPPNETHVEVVERQRREVHSEEKI